MTKKKKKTHPGDKAIRAIKRADKAAAEATAPYRRHGAIRTLSAFSEIGDQPPPQAIAWGAPARA
ncbi:hypothetical protein IC614_07550 [Allosphingosinicella flava]|uniref:Uncharacterized protein n=1 Tax=Allosphingosinicella flava TaxID=2771430 RepID=A0A7T2LL73_9SPHN|nr:hypothetical protein [Sphingosinicella flava]QPQ54220.1 hypothetical protein IC614_07550 [Sphingosinicella flava]